MKEFDFNEIGKRMPYEVEDGFFDKLRDDVLKTAKKRRGFALSIGISSSAVAAAAAIFLALNVSIFDKTTVSKNYREPSQNISEFIAGMSDSELEEAVLMSDIDDFYYETD